MMGWGISLWMNWKQKKRRDRSHAKSAPLRELLQILFYGNSATGNTLLYIDCIAIKDEYGNTTTQRAELDWLLYNKPLEYTQLVLGGEVEHYLSLGRGHGRLEDQ